jgi:multidrug transporter EmrE-like cation transporter
MLTVSLVALFLSISLGVAGQLLLKWVAVHVIGSPLDFRYACWLVGALLVYSMGVVNWIVALRRLRLSVAYPVTSLSYVGILWGSSYWFNEHISLWRMAGVVLIFVGVLCVVFGVPRGERAVARQSVLPGGNQR